MELEHAADAVDCHPDQVFPLGVYATKVVRKVLRRPEIGSQFSSIISTSVFSPRQLTNIWIWSDPSAEGHQ